MLLKCLSMILEDLDVCGTAGVLQRELAVHTSAVKGLEWTTGKFLMSIVAFDLLWLSGVLSKCRKYTRLLAIKLKTQHRNVENAPKC
jgi:hypothetical protein